jgi:hypothetical protein
LNFGAFTQCPFLLEAAIGIEPMNKAFAELCLTTWLRRHSILDFRLPILDWLNNLNYVNEPENFFNKLKRR